MTSLHSALKTSVVGEKIQRDQVKSGELLLEGNPGWIAWWLVR